MTTNLTGPSTGEEEPLPWVPDHELLGRSYVAARNEGLGGTGPTTKGDGAAWFWTDGWSGPQYYDWCGQPIGSVQLAEVASVSLRDGEDEIEGVHSSSTGLYDFGELWTSEPPPGTVWTVAVEGLGDIPSFELEIGPLPPMPVVRVGPVLPSSQLTVNWDPMGTDVVTLRASNWAGQSVTCYAHDDGSFDIPREWIQDLIGPDPGTGMIDWLGLSVQSQVRVAHDIGGGALYDTWALSIFDEQYDIVR